MVAGKIVRVFCQSHIAMSPGIACKIPKHFTIGPYLIDNLPKRGSSEKIIVVRLYKRWGRYKRVKLQTRIPIFTQFVIVLISTE